MKRNEHHSVPVATPTPLSHWQNYWQNYKRDVAGSVGRIAVELTIAAPGAEKVFVAGNFNDWSAGEHRLRGDRAGSWSIRLWLAPGRYEYRFIVDGEWQDDPCASTRVANAFGSTNCVIEVSPRGRSL